MIYIPQSYCEFRFGDTRCISDQLHNMYAYLQTFWVKQIISTPLEQCESANGVNTNYSSQNQTTEFVKYCFFPSQLCLLHGCFSFLSYFYRDVEIFTSGQHILVCNSTQSVHLYFYNFQGEHHVKRYKQPILIQIVTYVLSSRPDNEYTSS